MFGVNMEMLQKAREFGDHFSLEVKNHRGSGLIELNLVPKDQWGRQYLEVFRESLMQQFCSQLYTYFGVRGNITDVE